MSPADWPDSDALLALVRRLADDPVAHADFAGVVYLPLLREVQALHPAEDPARVTDVVGDLVLGFVTRPGQYDPARLSVGAYLRMAADGGLTHGSRSSPRR